MKVRIEGEEMIRKLSKSIWEPKKINNFLFGRNIEAEFEKISNISFIVFLIAIGNKNIYKCARLILLHR